MSQLDNSKCTENIEINKFFDHAVEIVINIIVTANRQPP